MTFPNLLSVLLSFMLIFRRGNNHGTTRRGGYTAEASRRQSTRSEGRVMGDEEGGELTLEQKLAKIVESYDVLLAPLREDRAAAAADLDKLAPAFTEELAKLKAKQTGGESAGVEASELTMKMQVARDFHLQRISECDAKIGRLLQARTKEELAEKKAAEPPPEEE